jgi:hypothetical protein
MKTVHENQNLFFDATWKNLIKIKEKTVGFDNVLDSDLIQRGIFFGLFGLRPFRFLKRLLRGILLSDLILALIIYSLFLKFIFLKIHYNFIHSYQIRCLILGTLWELKFFLSFSS